MIHARKDYKRIQDLAAVVEMLKKEYSGDEVCLRQIVSLLEEKYGPLTGVEPIPEDELVFLVRSKDMAAPQTVRYWSMHAAHVGASASMCQTAHNHADAMEAQQRERGKQVPDMPEGA